MSENVLKKNSKIGIIMGVAIVVAAVILSCMATSYQEKTFNQESPQCCGLSDF